MAKRGAAGIVRGASAEAANAALFAIEQRFGVPPGPLIAIWGMETGFGAFIGNQTPCRRWQRWPMIAGGPNTSPTSSMRP